MKPIHFPESNTKIGPPAGFEESQIAPINAHISQVIGGSCDGVKQVVVAWMPTPEELEILNQGKPIFVSFMGGLLPHYLSMDFDVATNPK